MTGLWALVVVEEEQEEEEEEEGGRPLVTLVDLPVRNASIGSANRSRVCAFRSSTRTTYLHHLAEGSKGLC